MNNHCASGYCVHEHWNLEIANGANLHSNERPVFLTPIGRQVKCLQTERMIFPIRKTLEAIDACLVFSLVRRRTRTDLCPWSPKFWKPFERATVALRVDNMISLLMKSCSTLWRQICWIFKRNAYSCSFSSYLQVRWNQCTFGSYMGFSRPKRDIQGSKKSIFKVEQPDLCLSRAA